MNCSPRHKWQGFAAKKVYTSSFTDMLICVRITDFSILKHGTVWQRILLNPFLDPFKPILLLIRLREFH